MESSKQLQFHRQSDFKRGIDAEDARRRRDDKQFSIRKEKREQKLSKKRHAGYHTATTTGNNTSNTGLTALEACINEDGEVEHELFKLLQEEIVNEELDIKENVKKIHSESYDDVIEATIFFRILLSRPENPPIQKVIASGIIPRLIFLSTVTSHPNLQYEALWVLTNIASGTEEDTQKIVDANGIAVFTKLLNEKEAKVRDQAVWVLGNIAGDSYENKIKIMNEPNAIDLVVKNIEFAPTVSMTQNAIWLASNLIREKPYPPYNVTSVKIVPVLAKILNYPRQQLTNEIITEIFWVLSFLTDESEDSINLIFKYDIVDKIIDILQHNDDINIQFPAIRTLGNIVANTDDQTRMLIDKGILDILPKLFISQSQVVRKEALWTLSNILIGSKKQVEMVVMFKNHLLISASIEALHNDYNEMKVKKEAAYVILHLLTNDAKMNAPVLLKFNAATVVCKLLESTETDTESTKVVLKILNYLLSENVNTREIIEDVGCLDKIESLQTHTDDTIYELATEIVDKYFSESDELFSTNAGYTSNSYNSDAFKTNFGSQWNF